jgi:hypothetical protein
VYLGVSLCALTILADPNHGQPTLLASKGPRTGRVDDDWNVLANTNVEPDLAERPSPPGERRTRGRRRAVPSNQPSNRSIKCPRIVQLKRLQTFDSGELLARMREILSWRCKDRDLSVNQPCSTKSPEITMQPSSTSTFPTYALRSRPTRACFRMSRLVREEPDVLEVYITRVAAATSIPAAHISQALRQTVRHASR